jgi:hypothetical protein
MTVADLKEELAVRNLSTIGELIFAWRLLLAKI